MSKYKTRGGLNGEVLETADLLEKISRTIYSWDDCGADMRELK